MGLFGIIMYLLLGLAAGWLAGIIWKGEGFGALFNMIIGVAGSFLGAFLFRFLGISFHGLIGAFIASLAGALILLAIINQFNKVKKTRRR